MNTDMDTGMGKYDMERRHRMESLDVSAGVEWEAGNDAK